MYFSTTLKEMIGLLAPPLPPKMISAWRSNEGSLMPTGAIMVSMGN